MTSQSSAQTPTLIIVMGVSGSGKTTLAKNLANYLNYDFVDADDFHTDASREQMSNGIALTDEARDIWSAAILHHLNELAEHNRHCTIAFSGLKKRHRDIIQSSHFNCFTVLLDGDKKIIEERMQQRIEHFMPVDLLESQIHSMELPEENQHTITIDISLHPHTQLSRVLAFLDQVHTTIIEENISRENAE